MKQKFSKHWIGSKQPRKQRKSFRRNTGERVAFMDNAVALLKDEKGNPKGTQIKGAVAREVLERWPAVAKIASIVY